MGFRSSAVILLGAGAAVLATTPAAGLVISELYYHPRAGDEALELVEIANDSSTPQDLSGYSFTEGIRFTFPQGTILAGNGFLVLAADAEAVRARLGIENVLGNFEGQLDNGGEELSIVNHVGALLLSMSYDDEGRWPAAADGTGQTLALRNVHADPREPESWAASLELGGTPGQSNFPEPGAPPPAGLVFNELFRGAAAGTGWVEIFNAGAVEADLSGLVVTDDPQRPDPFILPQGTRVASRGFLVLEESATGLDLSSAEVALYLLDADGLTVSAAKLDHPAPPALAPGSWSEARFPDGSSRVWATERPTRGAPNEVTAVLDIVLNELFYHPPEERPGEYLELFHRGTEPRDLSGFRFTKGIDFTMPDGTMLRPGEHLVIAADPVLLRETHGVSGALGPFAGQLANDGENVRLVDRLGNLVDEVRYWDGGRWPEWADGRGSSLELIDPRQDNDAPSAWEASDERAKATWEEFSFTAADFVPAAETELHLFLVGRGACHVDDVSIVRVGEQRSRIPNGGFEDDLRPWRLEGTHVLSRRTEEDSHTGSACLELVATAKGDSMCNRVETDTSPAMAAGDYDVTMWVRWHRGANVLVAHGEYSPGLLGPLSRSAPAARFRMTIPWSLGTPGAENSARRRLRAQVPDGNLGPVIGAVRHSPPSPVPAQVAAVTAMISDADGVASVRVFFRLGSAAGDFTAVDLLDDGAHGDGTAGDGLFGGEIPSFSGGTRVVYFIEAIDALGHARRFPLEAPARTLVYRVEPAINSPRDFYRIVLDAERTAELQGRPLHSNDPLEGTFVFKAEQSYAGATFRYRGSPWGRPSRQNLRVRFPRDDRFHRGRRGLALTNRGSAPNEGVAYFLVSRNGTPEKPAPAADYLYAGVIFNGANLGTQGAIQTIDTDYIAKWYGEDAVDGAVVLKGVGRLDFTDDCHMRGWDGASLAFRGEDTESYRSYWFHSVHAARDTWDPFVALARVMDPAHTPDAAFDGAVDGVLDIEAFLRVLGARILVGSSDALFITGGHNGLLAYDPGDRLWELLPFDLDSSFGDHIGPFPGGEASIVRLLSRPEPRRTYLRILAEAMDGYWAAENIGPFLDALDRDAKVPARSLKGFLSSESARIRELLAGFEAVPFRITSGEGGELTVAESVATIEGEAPVRVASMVLARAGHDPERVRLTWLSPTRWQLGVPVPLHVNELELVAFDRNGGVVGTARLVVRNTNGADEADFIRGDVDRDLRLSVTDAIGILLHLFQGRALACGDAMDVNDDGELDLADSLGVLLFLFQRGAPPPAPFPRAGQDPTPDNLRCPATPGA